MLILPIQNSNIRSTPNYISLRGAKHIKVKSDIVDFSGGCAQLFKRIRFKTAEKLYQTECILSGENFGKKSLSTFVLDGKNGKPLELFIMAYKGSDGGEIYELYKPETKYCQALVGACYINLYPEQKIIEPWFIYSNDESLQGIGLRCHQLAIERMLMEKYKNVVFKPDSFAYKFHIGAGYDVVKDGKIALPNGFYYKPEDSEVDKGFAEFVEHICQKMPSLESEEKIPDDCFLFLSPDAKKDWKIIIEEQSILIGNKLEEFFYKGGSK